MDAQAYCIAHKKYIDSDVVCIECYEQLERQIEDLKEDIKKMEEDSDSQFKEYIELEEKYDELKKSIDGLDEFLMRKVKNDKHI